jgi:hypothetical protein
MGKKAHPGFNKVASKIAHEEHIPMDRAKAILAARTRHDSAKAKRKNPRLKKVKG